MKSQSFNVKDIRRVREELNEHWSHMTYDEICRDISKQAAEAHRRMDALSVSPPMRHEPSRMENHVH